MFHNSNQYDRDYDNRSSGNSWTRGFGIGMGYSGGAGEAKKGETSERIGDYNRDLSSGYGANTGFSSNYGGGSNYSYGHPLEHNQRYNTTATHLTTYPTTTYHDSNRFNTQQYDTPRYNTSYPSTNQYSTNQYPSQYDTSRFSGYANAPSHLTQQHYYGGSQPNTGYRTVTETREIVRDSDRPYGHSNVYSGGHYDRSADRQYSIGYGTGDRHYSSSNYGRF